MKRYTLSAVHNRAMSQEEVWAEDDDDATMSAMIVVLNRAVESPIWAKGKITLRDATGATIQTMDAK